MIHLTKKRANDQNDAMMQVMKKGNDCQTNQPKLLEGFREALHYNPLSLVSDIQKWINKLSRK